MVPGPELIGWRRNRVWKPSAREQSCRTRGAAVSAVSEGSDLDAVAGVFSFPLDNCCMIVIPVAPGRHGMIRQIVADGDRVVVSIDARGADNLVLELAKVYPIAHASRQIAVARWRRRWNLGAHNGRHGGDRDGDPDKESRIHLEYVSNVSQMRIGEPVPRIPSKPSKLPKVP